MSYTNRQREWFHRVYGHQCAFYECVGGVWHRCPSKSPLEVHHIVPVRWSKAWLPEFNRDSCLNGYALCKKHHQVIHPDLKYAYAEYAYNKQSFEQMMRERDKLVAQGEPYWETKWDWMLHRVAKRFIFSYIAKHPNDLFPKRGVRSERYGNP